MATRLVRSICTAAAVLGAAMTAAPALAVPVTTTNIRPTTINPPPGSEGSVQSILNTVFGPGNVNAATGQSAAAVFGSAALPASTIPTMVVEYSGNAAVNKFGIWFGTDTSNILSIDLLLGNATTPPALLFPSAASIQFASGAMQVLGANCGSDVNCGVFFDPRITSSFFGFYIDRGNNTKYYSADQLNGGTARMLAYERNGNWLFSFEDGSDFDFNDIAIKVESLKMVPEPGTLALLGLGLLGLGAVKRRKG